jgi:steroid delta-isomerase-like uncharacterized protein
MSLAENTALVRTWLDRVINGHDPAAVGEFFASDIVSHQPGGETVRGAAAYQELASGYLAAFPDFRLTIDVVVAEDDRVAVRWTATGTQRGEFQGIATTGRRVTITGIEIDRVADGRVVETWTEFDRLGFLQQLGAAPGGK